MIKNNVCLRQKFLNHKHSHSRCSQEIIVIRHLEFGKTSLKILGNFEWNFCEVALLHECFPGNFQKIAIFNNTYKQFQH